LNEIIGDMAELSIRHPKQQLTSRSCLLRWRGVPLTRLSAVHEPELPCGGVLAYRAAGTAADWHFRISWDFL
jgi:hypothetical protein